MLVDGHCLGQSQVSVPIRFEQTVYIYICYWTKKKLPKITSFSAHSIWLKTNKMWTKTSKSFACETEILSILATSVMFLILFSRFFCCILPYCWFLLLLLYTLKIIPYWYLTLHNKNGSLISRFWHSTIITPKKKKYYIWTIILLN